jgi:hypothetical protein
VEQVTCPVCGQRGRSLPASLHLLVTAPDRTVELRSADVLPFRGGADTPENVRLAHWECNREKHTRIVA